jgi:CarboxypepD_reg-like domain
MKPSLLTFIYCLVALLCSGQDYISLRGKVLDRKSGEPLPYANIGVGGASQGTVSDESGEFEFFIPQELTDDSLTVSFLGYKTFKRRNSEFKDFETIYLDESPTLLEEITVSGDGARKLVEEALTAIPQVYPTTPYIMEGFHRSWEKVDYPDSISYPGTLIEAAVTIYDPGYDQRKATNKSREEIYLNEIRRSAIREGWDYSSSNVLRIMLNRNAVRHNREPTFISLKNFLDFPNELIYEWEGSTQIDGESISIVRIEIPNKRKFPASYKVFISDADHAILRFDLLGSRKEIDYSIGEWHTDDVQSTYIFKRFNQKSYLSYARTRYTIKKLNVKEKKVVRTENYFTELLINNVQLEEIETSRRALSGKKAKEVSMALQTKGYNEDFWRNYNVLKENPIDREIREYFEKEHAILQSGRHKKK